MYHRHGYTTRVIFEGSIPQLRETTLDTLIKAEDQGYNFFFFKDSECKNCISVKEAENRRINNMDSYHKIYVIEGKLN